MIARKFEGGFANDRRTLIFASGVSDSSTISKELFEREEQLLEKSFKEHKEKTLVYFSTCSIFDPTLRESAYTIHKKKMEHLIGSQWPSYLICRTTNIVGSTGNPHTLINFLYQKICSGGTVEVWKNANRNILDIDDLYTIIYALLKANCCRNAINVFSPVWYTIPEIIYTIEKHAGITANCRFIDKGSKYEIPDSHSIALIYSRLGLFFSSSYLAGVIRKYYPARRMA